MHKYLLILCLTSLTTLQCKKKDESADVPTASKKDLQSNASSKCPLPTQSLSLVTEEKAAPTLVIKDLQISPHYPYQLTILSDSLYDVAKISYGLEGKNFRNDYTLDHSFTLLAENPGLYEVKVKICDGSNNCSEEKSKQFTSAYTANSDEKEAYALAERLRSELVKLAEKRVKLEKMDSDYKYIFLQVFNEVFIKHPDKLALAETICGPIVTPQLTVMAPQGKLQDPRMITITKTVTDTSSSLGNSVTQIETRATEDVKSIVVGEFKKISKYLGISFAVVASGFLGKSFYDLYQMKMELRLRSNMYEAMESVFKTNEWINKNYSSAYTQLEEIRGKYSSVFDTEISQWLDEVRASQERLSNMNENRNFQETAKNLNKSELLANKITSEEAGLQRKLAKLSEIKRLASINSKKSMVTEAKGGAKYAIGMLSGSLLTTSGFLLADVKESEVLKKLDVEIYSRLVEIQFLP